MEERKNNNGIFYVVISLVAVLGIGSALFAFSGGDPKVVVEGDYSEAQSAQGQGDGIFGAFPGTEITIDRVNFGSDLSTTLDYTTASTTPGLYFNLANYGAGKICNLFEVDI